MAVRRRCSGTSRFSLPTSELGLAARGCGPLLRAPFPNILQSPESCPGGGSGLCPLGFFSPWASSLLNTSRSVSESPPTPSRNNQKVELGQWRLLSCGSSRRPGICPGLAPGAWCARPGSVPGTAVPTRARSWASAPSREIECSLAEANGPGSGSSWLVQASGSCRPPPSKRKTCFSLSFVFPSHKRPGECQAGLCSAAWRPGKSWCQTGRGGLARGSKGADLPLLPGFLPGLSFLFSPFPSPSSCAHSGSVSARVPRRAASFRRAVRGWWWEARLPERKEKRLQPSLLVRKPEGKRNASLWRPNVSDQTVWKAELCKQILYLPCETQ